METHTCVKVGSPVTETDENGQRYTTYLISLESSSRAFSLSQSLVRRRYSDFVWLRKRLALYHPDVPCPPLPPKTFFSSRFDAAVIEGRSPGLQSFIESVTKETRYMADSTLHLFLQTQLNVDKMDTVLRGEADYCVTDAILAWGKEQDTFNGAAAAHTSPPTNLPLIQVASETNGFAEPLNPHDIFSPTFSADPPGSPHSIFSPTRPRSILLDAFASCEQSSECNSYLDDSVFLPKECTYSHGQTSGASVNVCQNPDPDQQCSAATLTMDIQGQGHSSDKDQVQTQSHATDESPTRLDHTLETMPALAVMTTAAEPSEPENSAALRMDDNSIE